MQRAAQSRAALPNRPVRQSLQCAIGVVSNGIDPQASAAHPRHFPGQKLRLGGDALGADPTYLLYLPYRSRGELRRIDFAAWPRTATFRLKLSPESAKVHASGVEQQAAVGPQVKRRGSAGARVGPSAQVTQSTRLENIRTLDPHSHAALTNLSSWLGPTREIHEPGLHF